MSQPQPKSNFVQTFLLVATLFFGYQLFTSGFGNKQPDTRSATDVLNNIRRMNREVLDISIAKELPVYEQKVDELFKKKSISKDQRDGMILEATVLTANAALKGGIIQNDLGRMTTAFNLMDHKRKEFEKTAAWTKEVAVAPIKQFSETSFSPAEMEDISRTKVAEKSRTDLVLGVFPGWQIIDFLVALTGKQPWFSYTFACFLLAVIVRIIVFPLAQKQLMASKQMMQLQPYLTELKKKHTDKKGQVDNMALQQDQMNLYKEYGINPFRGCGPAFLQLPLFLLVFQFMLHYKFEFLKGYLLWVNPGTSLATNGFTAPNLGVLDPILLVVYGISMVIATLLQPVNDPAQLKQQRMMGVMVSAMATIMMFFFPLPSAFVVYWIFLNIFSTAQSLYAARLPVPPLVKVQSTAGGLKPRSSFFEKIAEQARLAEEERKRKETDA